MHSGRSVMHLADVHAASEPTAMSYLVASSEADAAHAHVQSVLTSWSASCARAPAIASRRDRLRRVQRTAADLHSTDDGAGDG